MSSNVTVQNPVNVLWYNSHVNIWLSHIFRIKSNKVFCQFLLYKPALMSWIKWNKIKLLSLIFMPKTLSTQSLTLLTWLTNCTNSSILQIKRADEAPCDCCWFNHCHSKWLCVNRQLPPPHCELSERSDSEKRGGWPRWGTISAHYHPRLCNAGTKNILYEPVWIRGNKEWQLLQPTSSAFLNKSTLSALYELKPATWIQYHSKQTLMPQWWRKCKCQSVLGSDTCHSFHCLIIWNVGISVYCPEGFLGLLSNSITPALSPCLLWNNTIYLSCLLHNTHPPSRQNQESLPLLGRVNQGWN